MIQRGHTIEKNRMHGGDSGARNARDLSAGDAEYVVRVIGNGTQFDDLAGRWKDLLECAEATVFQTFEWQRTWWKYFGDGRDLKILLIERDGKPDGIFPLYLERVKLLGVPVARHLRFIGSDLSDYLSPIIRRGREAPVIGAVTRYIKSHRSDWDVFDLEEMNQDSPCLELLTSSLERERLPMYRYHGTVCPSISLPGSMEELLETIGPRASNNLKRKRKRLHSHFSAEIELVQNEPDDIEGAVSDFASIHGRRWKSLGYPSAFDDARHLDFHVEVSKALARAGCLRMYFLKVDGKRVAVNYVFTFRSVSYMYQGNAYAPGEVMKCSPGLLVAAAAIEGSISEGDRVYDFMRGDERYKYHEWNAVDSKNWLVRTSSTSTGGRIRFYFFLWAELFSKAGNRIRREWYDYRRFRIAGKGRTSHWKYLRGKIATLFRMYIQFLSRHFRRQKIRGGMS